MHGLSATGHGVHGKTNGTDASKAGVHGEHPGGGPGVHGLSTSGHGVHGMTSSAGTDVAGVHGEHTGSGPGVHGVSASGHGVHGATNSTDTTMAGVHGKHLGGGIGVLGKSAKGIGVHAHSDGGGVALHVTGAARFDGAAGSGTLPSKGRSVAVANAHVTATSHITITLLGDPGTDPTLWVEPQPGTGFVLHATKHVNNATPFTYLIVDA